MLKKPDKNRLIFGVFLVILVGIAFMIFGHFKIPSWPAFLVMICFLETHMDKQKIPNILAGGLFGMANLIVIKYFIQFLAPYIGLEASVLLYMLIFIYAIIGLGESLPIVLNNYAFLFFTIVGIVYKLPDFNLFLLMGVELVGGAIFIAAILGIIKIVTIMAIKRATKAAALAQAQAAPAAQKAE
ncbi:MAG TPA: hypothetical protein VKO67_10340 [Smithellaceae bacterium]|nr:hypothetical protein [Smithellaceae bacterium]